jgi:DNA-binding transcriptional ArsR family regulator
MKPGPDFSDDDIRQLSRWFQGLAHGLRLEILAMLSQAGGELPAWDFALKLVRTVSEVNHHLCRLCETGLVVSRQDGRRRVYRLAGRWVAELLDFARQALPRKPRPRDRRGMDQSL